MAKPTLQSKAYQMILDKIISGEFQPGAEMREAPLAQALGISVTPIREALRRLEREGWLETFPYRGCLMRRISREELIQLSLMRESLEVVCVEQFCRNGTEQDIELVEENLRNSRRLMERVFAGELDESAAVLEMYQLDKEFHQLIIAGAHRSWLEQELRKWSMQLQTYAALTELPLPTHDRFEQIPCVIRQHEAISLALQMGWSQAAQELIRIHIRPEVAMTEEQRRREAGFYQRLLREWNSAESEERS